MQDNIYAAPESNLNANEPHLIQEFYLVSKLKFYILFFSTIGFYGLYWNYKNWKQYKITNNEDIWPIARTIFAIFFTHALYAVIDMRVKEKDKSFSWHPNLWATLVIISLILDNALSRIESTNIIVNLCMFGNIFARGYFVFQAQSAINIACSDPEGRSNCKLTWINFIWIVPGLILFVLGVLGTFFVQ